MNKVFVISIAKNLTDEEIKSYLPAAKARRFGKLQKRALATALNAIESAKIDKPDLILNGTAMGCIETSLKILDRIHAEGENMSMPTAFMQSTHNTIASMIAIYTNNNGYNSTFSHGSISFECALQDAFLRIKSGMAETALVCKNDETTQLLSVNPLFFGHIPIIDTSEAWILSSNPESVEPLFEIEDVIISHNEDGDYAKIIKNTLCD